MLFALPLPVRPFSTSSRRSFEALAKACSAQFVEALVKQRNAHGIHFVNAPGLPCGRSPGYFLQNPQALRHTAGRLTGPRLGPTLCLAPF